MENFEPETIHARRAGPAGCAVLIVGLIVAFWVGLSFWGWVAVGIFALAPVRMTLAALGAVAATASGLWLAAHLLYGAWFPRRLELGHDAVRLVRAGPSGEHVEAHIPYRNIARVKPAKGRTSRLAVALHDPGDADTLIASAEGRHRLAVGVSYRLPEGWEVTNGEVAERLRRRCENLLDP
jgi:hypothetical protein